MVHYETESKRANPSMEKYVVSSLKQETLTKGLVAYGALLLGLDEYEDEFSAVERGVERELDAELDGMAWADAEDRLVEMSLDAARESLISKCEYDDPEEKIQSNIHLPTHLITQFDFQRGLGAKIEEAVVRVESMPWSSRVERVEDMRALVSLSRGEDVDTSRTSWFYDVLSGDNLDASDEFETLVVELRRALGVDTDDDEFTAGMGWEWDGVSRDSKITYPECRRLINDRKQTPAHRMPVIATCVTSTSDGWVEVDEELIRRATIDEETGDAPTKPTRERYVDELEAWLDGHPEWEPSVFVRAAESDEVSVPDVLDVPTDMWVRGEEGRDVVEEEIDQYRAKLRKWRKRRGSNKTVDENFVPVRDFVEWVDREF